MATLTPSVKQQFFDANGNPLAGGKLYTYAAGTTTPLATYTDASGGTPNTNPIILDSRGEANVWLGASTYKFVLTTSTNVEVWTVDNVQTDYADALSDLSASSGASLVGFLQSGSGATARTVQAKLRDIVSVKDFGAVGDGIADDTIAIQAAINSIVNLANAGKLVFPRATYRITASLTFPAGFARNQLDFQGSEIKYDGAVDATAAIFKIQNNQFYQNVFENGLFNCNSKCGFTFYAVGTGMYAIKANVVRNCNMQYPTVMNVQLGNQSSSGVDMDGADWLFQKCYFRANTPAISGGRVDADNCFNTRFDHCYFNADSGNYAAGHLQFWKGSGNYVTDAFFGFLGTGTSNYCIYVKDGNLSVFGANTEEGSILKTESMLSERKSIQLNNIMVNEGTSSTTPEYAIYAPVGQLTVSNCTFGKAAQYPRKIYAGDTLFTDNVYLGSNSTGSAPFFDVLGKYELDWPDRCWIEGRHLSQVNILNANPWVSLWTGSSTDEYPFGYQSSGVGTFTVARSTSNRNPLYAPYTALITVSSGAVSGNKIDGMECRIPIVPLNKNGSKSYVAVARGVATGLTGTTTVAIRVAFWDSTGGYVSGTTNTVTPDGSGLFEAFISSSPTSFDPAYMTVTVGLGVNGASGSIYLNNLSVLSMMAAYTVNSGGHWATIADAWTKYPKDINGNLEYVKAGVLAAGTGKDINLMTWAAAAPTIGKWKQGDVVWNTGVSAGGSPGWVCVAAGNPGTWKAMANVAA